MLNELSLALRRLPAEWERQEAVMLSWPHRGTDWAYMLDEVEQCFTQIALAILPSARLLIVTPEPEHVRATLAKAGADTRHIRIVEMPTNDTWARDFGPITVQRSPGDMLPLDFTFNGWGLKFAANQDNLATSRLGIDGLFRNMPESHRRMVLEGGSIESDGCGTILTTSECLLSPNRNPWMTKEQIERHLLEAFGARQVLWLDYGYLAGDDTDSHIDTLARLAPHDTILYVGAPDDPEDEHYSDLRAMRTQLLTFATPDGHPFNLIELPMADAVYDPDDGHRLPATYANFLILNDAVLLPAYGSPMKDELARQIMKVVFPDHAVRQIDCRALIRQHGSLHCVTMQLPAGTLCP